VLEHLQAQHQIEPEGGPVGEKVGRHPLDPPLPGDGHDVEGNAPREPGEILEDPGIARAYVEDRMACRYVGPREPDDLPVVR
jgi:hypothetical protein